MKKIYVRSFLLLSVIFMIVFFKHQYSRQIEPEINEVTRVASPTKEWTAQVLMVVYGDHWFVNVAKYEVRLINNKKTDIVYSTDADGPPEVSIRWAGNNILVIEDTLEAQRNAFKQPNASVQIEYRTKSG
jgi:hypothetical protein